MICARRDLCGGYRVIGIPTAILSGLFGHFRFGSSAAAYDRQLCGNLKLDRIRRSPAMNGQGSKPSILPIS